MRAIAAIAAGFVLSSCTDPSSPPASNSTDLSVTRVLVGAGDIAGCSSSYRDEATARLLDSINGTVFTLGDNAYPNGTGSEFNQCYHPSWGRHRARTRPAPGNHDYNSADATPYFSYFGSRAGPAGRGYYSYNLGNWHIVVLNSERDLTAQASWLRSDLAANPRLCTLAYWHRPVFTSGINHSPSTSMQPFFAILYNAGAEIVLSGHNHHYERFSPQTPSGAPDAARGIRQFIVGTGGSSLYAFGTPARNSQVRYNGGHGVLKLVLRDGAYRWQFISVAGNSFTDGGTTTCH